MERRWVLLSNLHSSEKCQEQKLLDMASQQTENVQTSNSSLFFKGLPQEFLEKNFSMYVQDIQLAIWLLGVSLYSIPGCIKSFFLSFLPVCFFFCFFSILFLSCVSQDNCCYDSEHKKAEWHWPTPQVWGLYASFSLYSPSLRVHQ